MGTKISNILIAFIFIGFMAGCDPAKEFCDDIGTLARVPDLVTLEPLQETYSKGDIITVKVSIANISPYFAEPNVNLLETTGRQNALLIGGSVTLFENNSITLLKVLKVKSNWYTMPYNADTDMYEFEVEITLENLGSYNFSSSFLIDIIGEDCNKYRFDTDIAGDNDDRKIIFEVL